MVLPNLLKNNEKVIENVNLLIKNVDDLVLNSQFLNPLTIFVYFKELVEDYNSMESDVDVDNNSTNLEKKYNTFPFNEGDLDLPAGVKVLS